MNDLLKTKRREGYRQLNLFVAEGHVAQTKAVCEAYELSLSSLLERLIEGQPLVRKSGPATGSDQSFRRISQGLETNLAQLEAALATAKADQANHLVYSKVITDNRTGQKLALIDATFVHFRALSAQVRRLTATPNATVPESEPEVLALLYGIPADRAARLPRRNSRSPGAHRANRLLFSISTAHYEDFEAIKKELYARCGFDSDDENYAVQQSYAATFFYLLRHAKQEKIGCAFSQAQLSEIEQIGQSINAEAYRVNLETLRTKELDLVKLMRAFVSIKSDVTRINN